MLTHIYSLFCAMLNAFTTLCSFLGSAYITLVGIAPGGDEQKCQNVYSMVSRRMLPGPQPQGPQATFPTHFPSLQVIIASHTA